ncbi:DUF4870 family protein [Pseudoduganella plicata]|uniref:Membrane protein n=1 Tax=Pseudoduganella plicata TaxID=321984 RepID=A0A4V1ATA9_9BURK|nr:hypothetical protein [Pseudoduganella plicata]QBQ35028.1 hypothetical protein E1742_01700 [Pseudoduganella plicata]GGZ06914.1 membrane protein [Pseudoduganella plicata]
MTQELVFDARTDSQKNWAWWLYVAHGISFLFTLGAFSFIPLILNYVKRPETEGTFVHSHHSWQIRSFWWYVAWMALGWVLFATIIGIPLAWLIWCGAWLWKAYRLIRGWVTLNNNQPI